MGPGSVKAATPKQTAANGHKSDREDINLVAERVEKGIAQWEIWRRDALSPLDVSTLAKAVSKMKDRIRGGLQGRLRDEAIRKIERQLFSHDHNTSLDALEDSFRQLEAWKISRTVERAVELHFLELKARQVTEELDAEFGNRRRRRRSGN